MSKQWLLIENKGEIDINALILMGGSTKRDSETAIGFFGSGNKYTIALMLKKGIEFCIYSGETKLNVTTKPVEFRDKKFDQILINGQETSLTTDMGPQWDSWMGIREWVSNSIDEPESRIMSTCTDINPREGFTRIYVEHHPDVKEVIENWDKYFSFDRIDAITENKDGKLFPNTTGQRESLLLYRKGIRCYYKDNRKTMYNYDLQSFKINESRVIEDTWGARNSACTFIINYATVEVAKKILQEGFKEANEYWEKEMEWYYYGNNPILSKSWRDAIGTAVIINDDVAGNYTDIMLTQKHYTVSREMCKSIRKSFPELVIYGIGVDDDEISYRTIQQTAKMTFMLKKSIDSLNEMEYNVNYDIEVVKFDKSEILGMAKSSKILLSEKVFDMGMKELVMTIMEENEHLKTGYSDETRAFQTHLIRSWVTEMENHWGIFL